MSDLSLPVEYENSWCEIKTLENILIAVGKIKKIAPKYIIVSDKNKKLPLIQPGTLIKFNIFSPEKEPKVVLGNIYTSSKNELSVVCTICLVNTGKRNFFRVETEIDAVAVYRPNERRIYPDEVDVVILDISVSGMQFKSTTSFKPKTIIGIKFKPDGKKEILCQCEIVRVISRNEDGTYNYGCRLLTDEMGNINLLYNFMFDKQQEFILKNNEMKEVD